MTHIAQAPKGSFSPSNGDTGYDLVRDQDTGSHYVMQVCSVWAGDECIGKTYSAWSNPLTEEVVEAARNDLLTSVYKGMLTNAPFLSSLCIQLANEYDKFDIVATTT